MENAEEIFHFLDDFSKRKPKVIPQELNDYLAYVARTGDPVYQWSLVKSLFKEKLLNVITDFYETTPGIEIPPYPNVDPFNYDIMKNSLLERLDSFNSAPFTVQRICELLTYPRKQYNRIDKFMRAIEKNILVVSTREPGPQRHPEPENGEPMERMVNGSDNNSEYNVDVEMEDMSWKENVVQQQPAEPQPSSSDTHISVDDIEARLQAKKEAPMDVQQKSTAQYESVTPPELNATEEPESKPREEPTVPPNTLASEQHDNAEVIISVAANPHPLGSGGAAEEPKIDVDMKTEEEPARDPLIIPEIKVDNAEMTEQRLLEESNSVIEKTEDAITEAKTDQIAEDKVVEEVQPTSTKETSVETNTKEELLEPKVVSDVLTSSEESSSSDNTDGNSNSPKTDNEPQLDGQEESNPSDTNIEEVETKQPEQTEEPQSSPDKVPEKPLQIQSDNYSISDVSSELPQPKPESVSAPQTPAPEVLVEATNPEVEKKGEEAKAESTEISVENKES